MLNWNVKLLSKNDDAPASFIVSVKGDTEAEVRERVEREYSNTQIAYIVQEGIDDLDSHALFNSLKGIEIDEDALTTCYLKERKLFGQELEEMLSPSCFAELNVLMERQDRLVDRLIVSHCPVIEKWLEKGRQRHASVESLLRSEYVLRDTLREHVHNVVEHSLLSVVEEICDILDGIKDINEILVKKIAKPSKERERKPLRRSFKPFKRSVESVSKEEIVDKNTLYICEACAKTFRAAESKCPTCKKDVEPVVTGQEEEAPELDVCSGGAVTDTGEQQGKVPEHDLKMGESLKETEATRKIVAKGIEDKNEADRIATSKQGTVVTDEEDSNKFMVIVQEAKEKEYKAPEDFTKKKREVIQALASVQKKIKTIEQKLEPLKKQKSELSSQVLEILQEAKTAGVRVDKVLAYIQEGRWQDPTYKKILEKAKAEKMHGFVKQLEELAKELIEWKEAILKVRSESRVNEGFAQKAKSLFKKIILAMKMLKERKEVKEAVGDEDLYSIDVDLTVRFAGKDVDDIEAGNEIRLSYRIEQEYRSWGIKGMVVSIATPVEISYTLVKWTEGEDETEEKQITIDPDKIDITWVEGDAIAPQELIVYLNPDGTLKEADLEVSYWKP